MLLSRILLFKYFARTTRKMPSYIIPYCIAMIAREPYRKEPLYCWSVFMAVTFLSRRCLAIRIYVTIWSVSEQNSTVQLRPVLRPSWTTLFLTNYFLMSILKPLAYQLFGLSRGFLAKYFLKNCVRIFYLSHLTYTTSKSELKFVNKFKKIKRILAKGWISFWFVIFNANLLNWI